MTRKLSEAERCENEVCYNTATDIVYSRKLEKVILCCGSCADDVVNEGHPEYEHNCENCGCMLPIN